MAELAVQSVAPAGLNPTFGAAGAGGDSFENLDGRTFLVVKNGGVAEVTVTVDSQVPCNQGFDHNLTVAVPAGGERWIGPFAVDRYNDAAKQVNVSYSDVTSVTVAAVRL